ncbi:MAG: DNA adenine methylase [Pseudomonadota bacterium]
MSIDTLSKPFIKWAGGKSQLIGQLKTQYPIELKMGLIKNYYEPFLGAAPFFLTSSKPDDKYSMFKFLLRW